MSLALRIAGLLTSLLANLFAVGLSCAAPAVAAEPGAACWRDYPIPTTAVNYERTFASGTLAPERIVFHGKFIRPGMSQRQIDRILGTEARVAEDWHERTSQAQCEYLLTVLRDHPDSMHLYKLGELKWKKMSGAFRVDEWRIPGVGSLRAFVHRSSARDADASYLYHLTFEASPPDAVQRKKGRRNVLVRLGAPRIEWDIDTNQVVVSGRTSP